MLRSILRNRVIRRVTAQLETSAPGPREEQPQTLRFQNCHQPQIYRDLGLDLRFYPPGLSALQPSVKPEAVGRLKSFIGASKSWPPLYPSAPPYYHYWKLSSQVASLTRGLTGLMVYSRPFTVLSLPFLQGAPSPSPTPMINCGSSPTMLSKLQELVLPCT